VANLIVTLDGEGMLHLLMRDLFHGGLFELVQTAPNSAEWETGLSSRDGRIRRRHLFDTVRVI
jgi:hypothetical protein